MVRPYDYEERIGRPPEKLRDAAAGSNVHSLENETFELDGYRLHREREQSAKRSAKMATSKSMDCSLTFCIHAHKHAHKIGKDIGKNAY